MLGVRDVDAARVLEFLNHCVRFGPGFEQYGKKFRFQNADDWIDVTRTTLRSVAAALVAAAGGERKVAFVELWSCAVESETTRPADATLRKYCQTLRDEWRGVLCQCGLDADKLGLPPTSSPIPLRVLDAVFDLDRVHKVQYKLRHPRLLVKCDGVRKAPLLLDGLEPDTWKVVGNKLSPEPLGKIAIDYSEYLSRSAFQIMHGEEGLRVQLLSKTNKLEYQGREMGQFVVPRGGEFGFADLTFLYWEGLDDPDKATPRFPPTGKVRTATS